HFSTLQVRRQHTTSSSRTNHQQRADMKTKILISAWMLLTAKTFAATALHHYTFDSPDVTDSIGTANGTLIGGATIASGRLNLDGSTGYVQFNQHIVPTPDSFSIAFFAQEVSPQPSYTEIIS